MHNKSARGHFAGVILLMAGVWGLASPSFAASAWFDNAWPFRRPVDAQWGPDNAPEGALCEVQILTAGKHRKDGSDVRVATDEGRLVPHQVLRVGPGDSIRVAFKLIKPAKRYYIYFGNEKPEPPPAHLEALQPTGGLLLEMKRWEGGRADSGRDFQAAWDKSKNNIGATILQRPFIGLNPFGEQDQTLSRIRATLQIPVDGEYAFALSADDRGALLLNGEQLIFSPFAAGDVRFNKSLSLKKGRHELLLWHLNTGGDGRISLVWKQPGSNRYEIIDRQAFGYITGAEVGALEEIRKPLTADFAMKYEGESFAADHYTHRYTFSAHGLKSGAALQYEWDFGDGQTATGPEHQHVYLQPGEYDVTLTARIGANRSTHTTRIAVHRDFARLDKPPTDEPAIHAGIIKGYNLEALPAGHLARAVWLHHRAEQIDAMLAAGLNLAARPKADDPRLALAALREAASEALRRKRVDEVIKLWSVVPEGSNLQPSAAVEHAEALLWWSGDFSQAVKRLEPFAQSDQPALRQCYGQALLLNQKPQEGAKLLQAIEGRGNPAQRAALSGAMARTIEFFISEKDADAADEEWNKWQSHYPDDFLDGYSLLLKTRIIELRGQPQCAAAVAEAFALARPDSPYAPRLLDRAATLLAGRDAERSRRIRELLKQKYPEDPLSQ